jgi:prepilin-type processing-associated H-X9-DG protein
MGLAMQNHLSALEVFPTGGSQYNPLIHNYVSGGSSSPGVPNGPAKQGLGWAYQILPYLEQGAVRGIVTQTQLQNTVIPIYFCPSRRSPELVQTDPLTAAASGIVTTVLSDYASAHPMTNGCASAAIGDSGVKIDLTKTHPFVGASSYGLGRNSFWCPATPGPPTTNNSVYDGVIVRTQYRVTTAANATKPAVLTRSIGGPDPVKASQIPDGMSNTMVVSEKVVRSDLIAGAMTPTPGRYSYSDDRGWSDGWDPDTVRSTGFQPLSDNDQSVCFNSNVNISRYCTGLDADVFFFGSSHSSGINAVFADGSVHPIAFDVDVFVFNALGSRNGAETFDMSQL